MNMTPEFKQFLIQFAELLKKHDVEIEATECGGYECYCDGMEFCQGAKYDEKGNMTRNSTTFKHGGKLLDYDDIERVLAKN